MSQFTHACVGRPHSSIHSDVTVLCLACHTSLTNPPSHSWSNSTEVCTYITKPQQWDTFTDIHNCGCTGMSKLSTSLVKSAACFWQGLQSNTVSKMTIFSKFRHPREQPPTLSASPVQLHVGRYSEHFDNIINSVLWGWVHVLGRRRAHNQLKVGRQHLQSCYSATIVHSYTRTMKSRTNCESHNAYKYMFASLRLHSSLRTLSLTMSTCNVLSFMCSKVHNRVITKQQQTNWFQIWMNFGGKWAIVPWVMRISIRGLETVASMWHCVYQAKAVVWRQANDANSWILMSK